MTVSYATFVQLAERAFKISEATFCGVMTYEFVNWNEVTFDYLHINQEEEFLTLSSSLDHEAGFNDQLSLRFYFLDEPHLQLNVPISLTIYDPKDTQLGAIHDCYFTEVYFETELIEVSFTLGENSEDVTLPSI